MPQVDMLVADELLPELSKALALLDATETSRRPGSQQGVTRVTLDVPYAPEGAETIEPVFQSAPDGLRVQSLGWTYAA